MTTFEEVAMELDVMAGAADDDARAAGTDMRRRDALQEAAALLRARALPAMDREGLASSDGMRAAIHALWSALIDAAVDADGDGEESDWGDPAVRAVHDERLRIADELKAIMGMGEVKS